MTAKVVISARRISSILANRNREPADVESKLSLTVRLSEIVARDSEVTFDDLVALGKYFKHPWSYFLIDEPEVFDATKHDNRSVGNQRQPVSPDLLEHVAVVEEMLTTAADLFPEVRYEVPHQLITTDTATNDAGSAIREFLGVRDDEQTSCRDGFEALRLWADALQYRGVYVAQRRIHDETIRAFSAVEGEHAVVVIDTADTPYARIFSLLHEYCHVVLRSTGICDLDDHSAIERHCNAVAAAAAMPRRLVIAALMGRQFGTSADTDDQNLQEMSHRLRVSQAALLIRLRDLGEISQDLYDALEHRRTQRGGAAEQTDSGGTYYPTQINRVGHRYARNVFAALDGGQIDRQDASALLEIREHLVPAYREELEKRLGRLT